MMPGAEAASDAAGLLMAARRAQRATVLAGILLFAGAFALYLALGLAYRTLPGYAQENNIFFGADHRDALRGWVPDHKGSHPLLLLIAVPACRLLGVLAGSYATGTIVFAALSGALAVAGLFGLVRLALGHTVTAAAVAACFGLTMTQLVFGGIPESYTLSTLSVLPGYFLLVLGVRRGMPPRAAWILAGVAALSVTLTNLLHTVACLAVALATSVPPGRRVRFFGTWLGATLGIAVVLSLLQKAVFPSADLFFMPRTFRYERYYVSAALLEHPWIVAGDLLKNFFLFDIVGTFPKVGFLECVKLELSYARTSVDYTALGWSAVACWAAIVVRAAWRLPRDAAERGLKLAACLSLAGNLVLHAIYGTDQTFLYTGHFAFLVIVLAAGMRGPRDRLPMFAWGLLAVLAGTHNLLLLVTLVRRFACPAG